MTQTILIDSNAKLRAEEIYDDTVSLTPAGQAVCDQLRKAELFAADPHCACCGCQLVARYGSGNSAVLVGDVLKCLSCAIGGNPVVIKAAEPPVENCVTSDRQPCG